MKPSIKAIARCRKLSRRRPEEMVRRKKGLEKGREARRRARNSGLKPAVTRVIEDKRKKKPKHKRDLLRNDQES
jgi:hypothetical protein